MHSKIWAPDKDNIQESARIRNLQRSQNPFPVNIEGPLSMFLLPEKLPGSEAAQPHLSCGITLTVLTDEPLGP